jgi:hypothetical protein
MGPFVAQQQTQIVRQSTGYITTHLQSLRTFQTDYLDLSTKLATASDPGVKAALEAQQAGLIAQMRQEADLIPNDVPADIRNFIATH